MRRATNRIVSGDLAVQGRLRRIRRPEQSCRVGHHSTHARATTGWTLQGRHPALPAIALPTTYSDSCLVPRPSPSPSPDSAAVIARYMVSGELEAPNGTRALRDHKPPVAPNHGERYTPTSAGPSAISGYRIREFTVGIDRVCRCAKSVCLPNPISATSLIPPLRTLVLIRPSAASDRLTATEPTMCALRQWRDGFGRTEDAGESNVIRIPANSIRSPVDWTTTLFKWATPSPDFASSRRIAEGS